jgi:hypothetical protein
MDELLTQAQASGFIASRRLVIDWISLGLLDQPRRRGLGRGRGTETLWPDSQVKLFLVLLDKRRDVKRVAPLCNVPVWMWLWFGDEYVPLRQTRRALTTWAGMSEHASSWKQARESARAITDKFAHPEAPRSARDDLTDLIAETAYGRPLDKEQLLATFRRVFNPTGGRSEVGVPGVRFRPEDYVLLIASRIAALARLRAPGFEDDAFIWARGAYLESRAEYAQLVPRIAADAEASDLFLRRTPDGVVLPPTAEETLNQACVDLITLLGLHGEQFAAVPGTAEA